MRRVKTRVLATIALLAALVASVLSAGPAEAASCTAIAYTPAYSSGAVTGSAGARIDGCTSGTQYILESCLQAKADVIGASWKNLSCVQWYRTAGGGTISSTWSRTCTVSSRTYISYTWYRMRGKLGSFSTVSSDLIYVDRYPKC